MEEKFIRRFESFQKSLDSLSGVRNRDITIQFVFIFVNIYCYLLEYNYPHKHMNIWRGI